MRHVLTRAGTVVRGRTSAVMGAVVLTTLVRLVSNVSLTRLLTAEAFGAIGIIASISTIFEMVSDIGTYQYVVRHEAGDQPRFLDRVWTIRLIRSILLSAAVALLSQPLAAYFGKPALRPLIAAGGLTFLLDGLSSMAFATAPREGRVWRLSSLELAATVVQTIVAIALAFLLRTYWSMMIAILVGGAVKAILSYAWFPGSRRRWAPSREQAAAMWRFSRVIAASTIVTLLLMQTDKLVLSRMMPLAVFGLYFLATSLAIAPVSFADMYGNRVLYPTYAEAWREGPERLAAVFYRCRRPASMLYNLAVGGLIGAAPLVIAILYPVRYAGAATFLSWLAISAMLKLSDRAAGAALIAAGFVTRSFWSGIVRLVWLALCGTAAYLARGPIGLVAAVGTMEVPAVAYDWIMTRRMGLFRFREEALLLACGGIGVGAGMLAAAVGLPLIGR